MQFSSPLIHTVPLGQTKQIWVKTVINAKYLLEIWVEFNVLSCLSQVFLFFAFLISHASLFEEVSQIKIPSWHLYSVGQCRILSPLFCLPLPL